MHKNGQGLVKDTFINKPVIGHKASPLRLNGKKRDFAKRSFGLYF